MITAPDLYGFENWYERRANVKLLVKRNINYPPRSSQHPRKIPNSRQAAFDGMRRS